MSGQEHRVRRRVVDTPDRQSDRIETVQLLRAVVVIVVMLSHAGHELSSIYSGLGRSFHDPFLFGNCGVDLFFVISGFIMVHTAWNEFARPGAAGGFMMRRLIRILPLYWTATTLMILVVIAIPGVVHTATSDIGQWVASYLLVPYAREGDGLIRPVLGLGWSLEYEMFFYFIFAISLFLPRLYGLAFAGLVLPVTVMIAAGFSGTTIGKFLAHPVMLEFVAGLVLGVMYRTGIRITRATGVVLAIAAVLMIYATPVFGPEVDAMRHIHYGIPSLLLVSAAALSEDDALAGVFRPGVLVGEISYSAYLTHPFLVGAMGFAFAHSGLIDRISPQAFAAIFVAVFLAAGIVLAWLVHSLFDEPVTRFLRRSYRRRASTWPVKPDGLVGH
ncbi:MAG: acyltransferase [Nitratireductor sp.]|nr:acyltransferase [Nitratireductor sp.]